SVFPIGLTVVTYEVTDASGNVTNCSFNVTITDTELPTISCPGNITQANDVGVCGATVNYANPVGADNCLGSVTAMTAGQASGTVFPLGLTVVTYEVTDASGNVANCSFNVTVNDTELPTIVCPADIVTTNILNVCGASVNYVAPVGIDNCPGSITVMTAGFVSGALFPVGVTVETFEVTDASGNMASCSFIVTVDDIQNPAIICPADITVNNDIGVCGAVVNYLPPTGTDNCPAPVTVLTTGLPSGSLFPIGTTTVTFEVTDASGNITTCSFDVTVNDNEVPTIVCPGDIIQSNDLGVCGATVTYVAPVGIDNCPASVTIQITGLPSGALFPVGTTTNTFEVTDASGNAMTCSFDVTINDTELPTIICLGNIIQNNDLTQCGAVVNYTAPIGLDNCPGSVTVMTAGQVSGTLFPVGTTTVTFEVTDIAGNVANCSFDVIINDTELPTISCPADIAVNNDIGVCGALINYVLPVGADNCPGSFTALIAGQVSGTIFPIGLTVVTYEVTDASGNAASCSFNVTVTDAELPTIVCPINITQVNDAGVCGAIVIYAAPVGNDNCPLPVTTLFSGLPSGSLFPVGTNAIVYEVVDASGNSVQCSFNITVTDPELPSIGCPPDQTEYFDVNCQHVLLDYTLLTTANDNCGILTLTQNPIAGTVLIADQLVTMTATDIYGNFINCSFTVFVSDSTSPAITCPGDQNVFFDATCQYILLDYTGMALSSDNCGATVVTQSPAAGTVIFANQTITLTADDGNGNTTDCTFDVIPTDNTPPGITCPGDQNVSFDINCQYPLQDYTGMALTSDNCGAVVVTQSPVLGTIITTNQTITLTATDGSGNITTCTFDVLPADNSIPTIACPGDQNVFFDTNCEYVLLDYTGLATIGDNCGVAGVIQIPAPGTIITNTTTVSIEVTDLSGNVNTCSFNVIPTDNIDPVVICPGDQTVSLDATCQYTMIDFTPLSVPTDNCGIATYTQTPAIGTIITTTQATTFTVIDAAGNTVSCTFDVDPIDDTPPTVACPADQIVSFDANCEFILLDYTLAAVTADNCLAPVLVQSPAPGTAITANQTVTITSTDAAGNISFCTFDVIPSDNTVPQITGCPSDQNDFLTNSCKFTIPDYTGGFIATDNCAPVIITQIPPAGTDVSINTIITMTADDGNGNTSTCSFNLFLTDTISPTINCPAADLDVFFDVNCEYILIDYSGLVSAFDNCDVPVVTQSPAIGTAVSSNQQITMISTDLSGNSASCTFNVIPQDTIAPVIGCPADTVSYLNDTCYSVLADYTALANTTANCEAVIVTQSPLPGTVFNTAQTVLLFGEDASGNVSFCSFNVTLSDSIDPVVVCSADVFSCDNVITYPTPTATDNCNVTSITRITGLPSGSTFPDGPTLMTFVATDDYGNTDTCTFIINVYVKPDATALETNISCFGELDGMIDLSVTGGNPPFSFLWSTTEITEDISGLAEGTYQVVVTDIQGCTDTLDAGIIEPDSLWIVDEVTPISCYGEVDGSVFVTVNGGTFPYSYNWSPSGGGNSANGLAAGVYTLQITDGVGCNISDNYIIVEPDSISLDADISQYSNGYQISVENGTDGFIDLTVLGGSPPFDYSWDNGEMTSFISDLASGAYVITIIDNMGCEHTESYFLDQPLAVITSNAFSPNGDGMNDFFVLLNIERYPDNILTVMNRWGDVVYEKAAYNNEWDGTPNKGLVLYGGAVPEGSYFYVLNLGKDQGKITGFIVINR
ncbi:MAG: gliding motility-associated-like protein, partial [Arenicella sp.]